MVHQLKFMQYLLRLAPRKQTKGNATRGNRLEGWGEMKSGTAPGTCLCRENGAHIGVIMIITSWKITAYPTCPKHNQI